MAPGKRSQAAPFACEELVHGFRLAWKLGDTELVEYENAAYRHLVPELAQASQRRVVEIQVEIDECEAEARRVIEKRWNRFAHIAFHHVDALCDGRVLPIYIEIREERLAIAADAARLHVEPGCLRFVLRIVRRKSGECIEAVEVSCGDAVEPLRRVEDFHQAGKIEEVRAVPYADLGNAPRHVDR